MIKYIQIDPFFYDTDERSIQMVKTASEQSFETMGDTSSGILKKFKKIKIRENCAYLLIIAMGAGEYWGPNRNGDYFEENELVKTHKRFVTEANIYVEHRNKDKTIRLGSPVVATYNQKMHRVELILEFDYKQAENNLDVDAIKAIEDIKNGILPEFSMGTHVKHDICSICGNKAKTVNQHCNHIKYEMRSNAYRPDGKRIYMFNPDPHFFDISVVNRGADRTAKGLLKVAKEDSTQDSFYQKLATIHELKDELEKKAKIVKDIKAIAAGTVKRDDDKKVKFLLNKVLSKQIKNNFKENVPFADKYDQESDPSKKAMVVIRIRQGGHSPMSYRKRGINCILRDLKHSIRELEDVIDRRDEPRMGGILNFLNMFKGAREDERDVADADGSNDFNPGLVEKSPKIRTRYTNIDKEDGREISLNKSMQLQKLLNRDNSYVPKLLGTLGGAAIGGLAGGKKGALAGAPLGLVLASMLGKRWFTPSDNKTAEVTLSDLAQNPVQEAMFHPFAKSASLVDDILSEQDFVVDVLSNFYRED